MSGQNAMAQSPPLGHESEHPAVVLHVSVHPPPSHVVSQPPVPVHAIVEPMPVWKKHASVPVQLAVQSIPHAALQPAPVHATAQ